jgi:hypothetical protein
VRGHATYAKIMIDREWPMMRGVLFYKSAATVAMDSIDATGTLVPGNMGESNAQTVTLEQLDVMHDARQRRIAINRSGVSWFEWLVLLVGAACVICFCWLYGLRNPRTQLLMNSTVVTVIVSILCCFLSCNTHFAAMSGSVRTRGRQRSRTSIKCRQAK